MSLLYFDSLGGYSNIFFIRPCLCFHSREDTFLKMESLRICGEVKSIANQQPVQTPSISQQDVKPQLNVIKEQTNGGKYMVDRHDLIYGTTFIGAGIIIFIFALWSEPLLTGIQYYQWIILTIRVVGVIFIFAGIVEIIAGLIPKKQR